MKWNGRVLFSFFLLLVTAAFVIMSFDYSPRGRLVPLLVGVPTLILMVGQFLIEAFPQWKWNRSGDRGMDLFGVEQLKEERSTEQDELADVEPEMAIRRIKAFLAVLLAYLVGCYLVGLLPASLIFLVVFLFAVKEKWTLALGVTLCTWLMVYLLFDIVLKVPFEQGLLFTLLQR